MHEAILGAVVYPVCASPLRLPFGQCLQPGKQSLIILTRVDSELTAQYCLHSSLHRVVARPNLIEKAKAVIGISARRAFSEQVLQVEISGPKIAKLTLVDASTDAAFVWALFGLC